MRAMSHCKGSEIRDIFADEDSGSNHFLPVQDGEEQALRALTFSDSDIRPPYNVVNDVKTSIFREDPASVPSLPILDGRLLPSALKEGSSNMLNLSWSSLSGKTAQALGLTKCSTSSSFLDCQGARIPTSSFGEDLNGTGDATLCSDYHFPGKMGVSAGNVIASVWTKEQSDGDDDLQSHCCPNIEKFENFDRMFRNLGSTFPHRSIVTEEEITWFLSTSHGFHGMEDTLQSVVLSSVSESSALDNTSTSHGLFVNNLLAIEPSAINTEIPSGTHCSPLPMYSDTERKGKSVLSDQAYVHAGIVEKSLAPVHIGYGDECRDPSMQATSGISQISFSAEEGVSPKKPTSLPEVAKQRELSGTLESEADAKVKKQLSDAKSRELSGHDIFGPPPENPPRPLAARNLELKGQLDFGEPAPRSIHTSVKVSNPAGGQSNITLSEEPAEKAAKKIHNQKFQELTGNDIFKGDALPASAEKPLSSAKLKEMSGSDIFADVKMASRDYFGGVRKPPGGGSSIALV